MFTDVQENKQTVYCVREYYWLRLSFIWFSYFQTDFDDTFKQMAYLYKNWHLY